MRTIPVLIVAAAVLASCTTEDPMGKAPVAKLLLPMCVSAGTVVQLDASGSYDPDGDITRYIFQIDHEQPAMILDGPYLKYSFDKVLQKGDRYFPYIINVTVQDDRGNRSALAEPLFMYVLPTDQECRNYGMEPGEIGTIPVGGEDTVDPVEDVVIVPEDTTEDVPLMDTPPPEDTEPSPDTVPTDCPWIQGRYLVQVFHQATKTLELDLELIQEGCVIKESLGIIQGVIDEDGTFTVTSSFPDIHMNQCVGLIEDVMYFEVDCGGEWFAFYTRIPG